MGKENNRKRKRWEMKMEKLNRVLRINGKRKQMKKEPTENLTIKNDTKESIGNIRNETRKCF